jgi:cell division protein FtsL
LVFVLLLFSILAFTWKAAQMADTLTHLDAARTSQQDLKERLKSLQLILQEASNYSRIEPMAREKLGMLPPTTPPIVIAPLDDRVAALPAQSSEDYLASRKDPEK